MGVAEPMCGAVSFCQRFGSLLNLNCHIHSLLPDGVFAANGNGVEFVPLPPPWPEDIDRLVQQIARASDKPIVRSMREEPGDEPAGLLELEQARSTEANSFPRLRSADCFPTQSHRRAAFRFGYSLQAERYVDADDREGLERLCRYGARAPIANGRLSLSEDGRAVIELKRPLYDGRPPSRSSPSSSCRSSPS